jgi:hypothetical protein
MFLESLEHLLGWLYIDELEKRNKLPFRPVEDVPLGVNQPVLLRTTVGLVLTAQLYQDGSFTLTDGFQSEGPRRDSWFAISGWMPSGELIPGSGTNTHIGAQNIPSNATAPLYLDVNIGPGPNSVASLHIQEGPLNARELNALKQMLEDEDDTSLQRVSNWLQATRNITITLSGAHHELDSFDAAEPNNEPVHACLFCGERYRWAIRCSGNPEGLI